MELTLLNLTSSQPNSIRRSGIALSERLTIWYERYLQRRALLRLDDRMLKDIGITRSDAEQESGKPFWME